MIVYGDSEFSIHWDELKRRLRARFEAMDGASLDEVRSLLIHAGQAEQALEDSNCESVEAARRFTDATAEAFVATFSGGNNRKTKLPAIADALAKLEEISAARLTVKIPEGFEFYSLYPEQYIRSAEAWAQEGRGEVLVVGVRSIGTTLSAVVRAVLRRQGWHAERITVRPGGHPFERVTVLPEAARCESAIVVDEGPGLSGSSVASAAEALHGWGVKRENISFFPGSERQPGQFASERVRGWWAETRRYFTPLECVKWHGKSLIRQLENRTRDLLGSAVVETQDFGAGRWREYVFADEGEWPAVATMFERQKFRIVTRCGTALLWKFSGLGCLGDETGISEQIEERAGLGWTVAPQGSCHGFVAVPWTEGRPLNPQDADEKVLAQLAHYIIDVSEQPLSAEERTAALQRLELVIRENLKEEPKKVSPGALARTPGAGDGRMAPHEWLVTEEGRFLKTGAHAHAQDHTIAGRQPVLWDVAGVVVEWDLGPEQRTAFLRAIADRAPTTLLDQDTVDFYVQAYAAFRMGLMTLSSESADSSERERLRAAADRYRDRATNYRALAIA